MLHLMRWWCPFCARPNRVSCIFIVLAHRNKPVGRHVAPHYSNSEPASLCSYSSMPIEATNTNFYSFKFALEFQTRDQNHDLPHSWHIHHPCSSFRQIQAHMVSQVPPRRCIYIVSTAQFLADKSIYTFI